MYLFYSKREDLNSDIQALESNLESISNRLSTQYGLKRETPQLTPKNPKSAKK